MIDATQIIVAAIALIGTILTTVITMTVIPWLKSKINTQQYEQLMNVVAVAVQAAEQLYRGSGLGEEKLDYAIKRVSDAMVKYGFAFDENLVRAAIEAAVLKLNA